MKWGKRDNTEIKKRETERKNERKKEKIKISQISKKVKMTHPKKKSLKWKGGGRRLLRRRNQHSSNQNKKRKASPALVITKMINTEEALKNKERQIERVWERKWTRPKNSDLIKSMR